MYMYVSYYVAKHLHLLLFVVCVPYLDTPVSAAGNIEARMEVVPRHFVYCHVMCLKCVQEVTGVLFRTLVDLALLCSYQELVVFLPMKVKGQATTYQNQSYNLSQLFHK